MSKAERDDIRIEFTDASREIHGVMSIVIVIKYDCVLCINSQTTQNEIHVLEVQRCGPCKTNATTVTSAMGQYSIKCASMAKICSRDWIEQ